MKDHVCGYSFAMVDENDAPQAASASTGNQNSLAQIFGTGSGVPPMSTIQLVNDNSLGGPRRDQVSLNGSNLKDYNADGAVCLRSLALGTDLAGAPLTGAALTQSNAIRAGTQEVLRLARVRRWLRKTLRMARSRYQRSSSPRRKRGRVRIFANVSCTRSSASSNEPTMR